MKRRLYTNTMFC